MSLLSMHLRLIVVAVALVLQSCATPVAKTPPRAPAEKPAPKEVVILVSENIPAYSSVAVALAKQLGQRASIRYLSGGSYENDRMLASYRDDERRQFVSIGLKASIAAKTLAHRQVVFCQVFNYHDYDLVSATHKGVSMVPSIPKTFGIWRALAPDITDIGVISGPGLEDLIEVARAAAKSDGITLHHVAVNSDKEYQYAYKQMADHVQGYWLLPDNRVLSSDVLRDVMAFSVRNSKQVAVFNDELLNLGGLFSAGDDYQDIAQKVLERLQQAQDKEAIPGPDIVYPDKVTLRINSVMAERLNLTIPPQYRKHEQAF
jgi:ABC-type uncharacterized transport system substrate-binding protein